MIATGHFFFALAALIHLAIFRMESLQWGTPKVNKVFGQTEESVAHTKLFAFNQGFYNLFLALEILTGFAFIYFGYSKEVGMALISFSGLSMLLAACALVYSAPHLKRAFFIQGGPPFIGLLFFIIHFKFFL